MTAARAGSHATVPPLPPNAWLRWDVVARLLPPPDKAVRVLEVGCGQGSFAARLASRYSYVGLEPDAQSYVVAQSRVAAAGGTGEVRNGDLSALAPDEVFDLVCAFEVIEHIEDDAAALAEWVGRLRPGGSLLLSTPAQQKRFAAWDEVVGHYRRYDPPVLDALLRSAGLVNIELVHFGMPLGYALEVGRNYAGRKRLAAAGGTSFEERTSASGRTLQPGTSLLSRVTEVGTLPFRVAQRRFPGRGTGLVAKARRAST